MIKLASKKSQKLLDNLLTETRLMIKRHGNADWKWANTPVEESETRSLIRDMLRLIESKVRYFETDKKFMSVEKAEIVEAAIKIVHNHILDRLATYADI